MKRVAADHEISIGTIQRAVQGSNQAARAGVAGAVSGQSCTKDRERSFRVTELEQEYATVTRIAREVGVCMLTTSSVDDGLRSRPMATQVVEFDGDAWFVAARNSTLVADIAADPHVNVAYAGSGSWLSLSGRAVLVEDETKKGQLWNDRVQSWFPNGPRDPNVVLVKVEAHSAEYWDSPGGKPIVLAKMALARARGTTPNPGSSGTVNLE
jgi:general stress protein 26